MSCYIGMIASTIAAFIAGRLSTWPATDRLHRRLSRLRWALRVDPLTEMYNRTGLAEVFAERQRTREYLTLVMIDLDGFKAVNDTHGHDVGDELLIVTAERIDAAVALYDGIAARLAGDEFVVLLPVRNEELDEPVERILAMISDPATAHTETSPITLAVTASAGICRARPEDDLDELLRCADVAMYHAKRNGGDRPVHYYPGMVMPIPATRKGPRLRDRSHHGEAQ